MTHKIEILFQSEVADLSLFNYLDTGSHDEPHAQIHAQDQGLSPGCNPQKKRKS